MILEGIGVDASTEAVEALKAAERDKSLFNLENDSVGAVLLETMQTGGGSQVKTRLPRRMSPPPPKPAGSWRKLSLPGKSRFFGTGLPWAEFANLRPFRPMRRRSGWRSCGQRNLSRFTRQPGHIVCPARGFYYEPLGNGEISGNFWGTFPKGRELGNGENALI